MDVFSAPEVGTPEAIQGRGSTAGTSTDIIYPVSKLVKGQLQPGRTIEFNFKSSPDRWWHPRSTRLVVHYKAVFGEVDATCADPIKGPSPSRGARPSKAVSFTPLPNTSLFGTGQARYTCNGVVCENSNHLYDQAMVQMLLTQNREAGQGTSASNMLTDLSKDSGLPVSSYFGGSYAKDGSEAYSMLPVVKAPYRPDAKTVTGTGTVKIDDTTTIGELALATVDGGREAIFSVHSAAESATTLEVTEAFGAVIKVGDAITVAVAGANAYALAADTTVVSNVKSVVGRRTITLSKAATAAGAADAATRLQVVGNDFDTEKMTLESLSHGLAVKVKGDTAKRSGIPNSRFEILQQGFVPNATGGGLCEMQVSEPLLLSTWSASNYAIGPGDHSLFLTVSPDFADNLFYDHSGEYAALSSVVNCNGDGSDSLMGRDSNINARTISVSVESVELHVSYIHPATPYIPKSLSIRHSPIQITTRKIQGDTINESFTVPVSTKSVMLFMRQAFTHVCADRAELSLAGSGVNIMGTKHTWTPATTDAHADLLEHNKNGKFLYDNQAMLVDSDVDPRLRRPTGGASVNKIAVENGIEVTRPYGWKSLQVQLGSSVQPREMLTQMDPANGNMSRLWQLYTSFIGRSQGYRGSAMSYSEFCGYHNSSYSSGTAMGDRGAFAVFDMEQAPGSIATDLQVRGSLLGNVNILSKQEIVCVAVSDSIWNIAYQSPSATPVMTQVAPILS